MPNPSRALSLKTRWRIWRARYSAPALLARFDERKIVSWISAVNGGMTILVIALAAWISNSPLVFPALGPTAFILFTAPLSSSAAPRSVVLGHHTTMACGFVVWQLVGYLSGELPSMNASGWPLLCSTSLALAVSCSFLVRLACHHPPACASGLVIAMGGVPHWPELLFMSLAVWLVTAQSVLMNRAAGLPVPLWAPRQHEDL